MPPRVAKRDLVHLSMAVSSASGVLGCVLQSERGEHGAVHATFTKKFLILQCSFVEHRNYKVIYRRYASLFFLVGVDGDEVRSCLLHCLHGLYYGLFFTLFCTVCTAL